MECFIQETSLIFPNHRLIIHDHILVAIRRIQILESLIHRSNCVYHGETIQGDQEDPRCHKGHQTTLDQSQGFQEAQSERCRDDTSPIDMEHGAEMFQGWLPELAIYQEDRLVGHLPMVRATLDAELPR